MRLNRTSSGQSPKTLRSSGPVGTPQAAEASENSPTEQWTGGQQGEFVVEEEAASRSDSEDDLAAKFPGIAEGLSKAYLRENFEDSSQRRAPLTLDPRVGTLGLQQSENSVFRLPNATKLQVQNCSTVLHRQNSLSNILSSIPKGEPESILVNNVFKNDSLLSRFCPGELEAEVGLRQPWLNNINMEFQLSFDHQELMQLENKLFTTGLFKKVCDYSECYFVHLYGLGLCQQTKNVMKEYFPEVYRDFRMTVQVLPKDFNNASHEWTQGEHRLALQYKDSLSNHRTDIQDTKTAGSFSSEKPYRRGTADLISFVHEYAHAIYDEILGTPASIKMDRVSRVLSEGFAVLLELLSLDHLAEDGPGHWSKEDIEDLIRRRGQRVEWLQGALIPGASSSLLAYAEGIELTTNLYRRGGLAEVKTFLEQVNAQKADSLSRSNPNYRDAVPKPDSILALLRNNRPQTQTGPQKTP